MLTSDQVRATVRKGVAHPKWIKADDPELLANAEELIAAYQSAINHQQFVLDQSITDLTETRADPILWKGLAKLLADRTTTETRAAAPPAEIRTAVFRAAGAAWPVGHAPATARESVLATVSQSLSLTLEQIESGLYADRPSEQWVTQFDSITPAALLHHYNLALAQATLLRAREVRIELEDLDAKRARALFRELKFRRLLARITPTTKGWALTLDGPLSLFKQTSRYGIALAMFLPALARCPAWTLSADISLGGARQRDAKLELSDESPLEPSNKHLDEGTWTSAEEEHFVRGFEALESDWKLERGATLVDLDGRDVLLPDYVLRHRDGREALLELVFAWRRQAFAKRLELLQTKGPPNLVVAYAERGGLDADGKLDPTTLRIVTFKGVIPPKRIIEAAEAVAVDTNRKRGLRAPRR